MIITCASCLTKFNLDDSRIPPKGVKVRCSRCHHVFYVVPPPETKEEVMEDFQSFARYHEDLMVPGEEPAKEAGHEEEEQEPLSRQKGVEKPLKESEIPKILSLEREEKAVLREEKTPREREEAEASFPQAEGKAEVKPFRTKETVRRKERRRPSLLVAISVIVLLVVSGLLYLSTEMISSGKVFPFLKTPAQKIRAVWNKVLGTERGRLDIGDLSGYEDKVGDLSLFVIEGRVTNQSRSIKKQIKVKVIIFDQNKVKMAEKEAVCGRILSRQELKSQSPAFFKGEIVIKPQEEKDMIVPPGKETPFMVVFRDPLSQAKEFKVEIVEAPNL